MSIEGLTWTCHVCGQERPDDKISVYSRPIFACGVRCGEENIRYCNDNPECIRKAPGTSHFENKEAP